MDKWLAFLVLPVLVGIAAWAQNPAAAGEIRLTILYDNYGGGEGLQADWGFSCLVQGAEKTILFDTGTKPDILRGNVERLGVDLTRVDMIVISHLHGDHTGGLEWVLSKKKDIAVVLPAMASDGFMAKVRQWGGQPLRVREPMEICPRVFSTGELPADFDSSFTEQSLVFQTTKGLLVLTGCSHPGIANIVRRAPAVAPGKPRVVLGGFHLMRKSDKEVRAIIQELQGMGVERCGASHCTGDRAIELFRESFAERFLNLGVGAVLAFPW
ncbi:MAG: MBL fold metallo-hydrolase [Candidatus Aminicenantes bacterium]|nr:MBL fold metallo-hydrolase [Candidatus Aminicenantes bacterium]